jgi:3-oxoacyl-[acyl-carrier-protein] synthase II
MRKRVVVTGMGVISSAGRTVESFARSLSAGKACFSRITDPRLAHLRARYAGIILDFDEQEINVAKALPPLDRFHALALAAAGDALSNARLKPALISFRMGVIVGTCSGPMLSIERHYERIKQGNPSITAEEYFVKTYESCAKILAYAFGISGISATIVTACSASLGAIGLAADLIRLGAADAMLVGGCDTLSPTTLAGFDGLKATCETACAPFSKPFGLSLGEASAFMVIEELDHARNRGAPIFSEIAGFGLSNDAYHCTSPDPSGSGQVHAMESALKDAGMAPGEIVYINAHGTGTEANDKTETKAVRRLFGDFAEKIPVSSTKSMVGHCLGAAGCLEAIATIVCMHDAKVYPPTANFSGPREGCSLDYVPDAGRPWTALGPAMSNNFAFGGNNASVVVAPFFSGRAMPPDGNSSEKIVITACGLVSPAGVGKEAFMAGLSKATPFAGDALYPDTGTITIARVPRFDMRTIDRRLDVRSMDKSSLFATAASRLALQEANMPDRPALRGPIGLFLHVASGSTAAETDHITSLLNDDFRVQQVTAFPYVVPNSISGNVCKALTLTGHNSTLCFGNGAGLFGLGFSLHALRNGHAGALLSGSVDELLPRALADKILAGLVRPDEEVPGEGACIFMLETLSHARQREAPMLGELCSIAYSTETASLMSSDSSSETLEKTMRRALSDAGIASHEIYAACFNVRAESEKRAVDSVMGASRYRVFDVSAIFGCASATLPLYNLAYGILDSSFETSGSKNYILSVFSSSLGTQCAAIIRKYARHSK